MKRLTIRDLARKANVSTSTVSRALRDHPSISVETREQIKALASQSGFQKNNSAAYLSTGNSKKIGIVLPSTTEQNAHSPDPFLLEVTNIIVNKSQQAGFESVVVTADREPELGRIIKASYANFSLMGLIVMVHDPQLLHELTKASIPFVIWGSSYGIGKKDPVILSPLASVSSNNYQSGRDVARHFLSNLNSNNRDTYLFVGDKDHHEIQLRYRGFCDELEDAHVKSNEFIFVDRNWTIDDKRDHLREQLANKGIFEKVCAIFCENDLTAFVVIEALKFVGLRIPDDVRVVGYDDISMARLYSPSLTTVRQDFEKTAINLIEVLLELIDSKSIRKIYLNTHLVIRDTG
jgi:DNA-binding LacI/PurR family transcriptional regulator